MRTSICAAVLLLLAALAGCHSSPKAAHAPGGKKDPAAEPASNPALITTRGGATNGMLAGQVIDRYERRAPGAVILVVAATDDGAKIAPIDTKADAQGYFKIPGLDPNVNYRLEARLQDGTRTYYGSKTAQPPDSRLLIRVSEELSPNTPAQVKGTPAPQPERKPLVKSNDEPVSVLDKPIVVPPMPPAPKPNYPPRNPLQINIHGPGDSPFPAPPPVSEATPVPPPPGPPMPSPVVTPTPVSSVPPPVSTASPIPSCVLVGRRLDNFALMDSSGQPWEYRRDKVGKLVLLDFWHTQCPPCLQAIKHLSGLQERYGAQGFEVIGIAYEPSSLTPMEQAQRVQSARGRFKIGYRTLIGYNTDPKTPCPVQSQFGVRAYPTMKLIDDTGTVVWEAEGFTDRHRYELEQEIKKRLQVR